MRIAVFTIFPELITQYANQSILARAQKAGLVTVEAHDIREYSTDTHHSVDDSPFGGGAGMVMSAEPIAAAIEATNAPRPVIYLGPTGERFDQDLAHELACTYCDSGFSMLCGRYEGVDQRALDTVVERTISLGDYVLAGGELAALVVLEATVRLIPGVLGNDASLDDESFANGLLEYPQYTRPATWRGQEVPEVLLGGNHEAIAAWRAAQSEELTQRFRPDLLGSPPRDTDRPY